MGMTPNSMKRTLATVAAETSGTNYYYVDELSDFRYIAIQAEIGAASDTLTITLEATAQDDGTALASRSWQDVTQAMFGVANITATGAFIIDSPFPFTALRVKTVSSGGNDDANYTIFASLRS